MGDNWQQWVQILVFALILLAPLLRWIFHILAPREQAKQQAGKGNARPRRGIHEVLEEIRREVEGEAPRPRPGVPQAPAPERRAEARGVQAPPEEHRRPRPREAVRRPQSPPQAAPPRRTAAPSRRPETPAKATEKFSRVEDRHREVEFRDLSHLKHLESSIGSHALGSLAISQQAPAEGEVAGPGPPTLLGMDLRQLILAQVILGPPRALQRPGAPGRMQPPAQATGGAAMPGPPTQETGA